MRTTTRPTLPPDESERQRIHISAVTADNPLVVGTPPNNAVSITALPNEALSAGGTWILVLLRDESARARIDTALRSRTRVVAVASARTAEQALAAARSRPVAAVVSATDADGRNCLPLVRTLTQLRPTVPVIGYCAADRGASRDVLALARAGVHDVMFHGDDDHYRAVRRFIDTAVTSSGVDDIMRAISPGLHVTLQPLVRYCLENPQVTSVAAVADAMGVHRKTLFVHCRGASAPPPGIIITWCRVLLAAHRLATSLRSVEAVASDLGFTSATALCNLTKRYTGLRPSAFRDGSAIQTVTQAFLSATVRAPSFAPHIVIDVTTERVATHAE